MSLKKREGEPVSYILPDSLSLLPNVEAIQDSVSTLFSNYTMLDVPNESHILHYREGSYENITFALGCVGHDMLPKLVQKIHEDFFDQVDKSKYALSLRTKPELSHENVGLLDKYVISFRCALVPLEAVDAEQKHTAATA